MANNKVDPFVIQWPQKWSNDPETAPTLKYLNRFLHDLWIRSGGGADFINEIELDVEVINARLDVIEAELIVLAARIAYLEGSIVVTAVNVTATGNTTIICTDALTVTMNSTPLDKDLVKVKARNGNVTINGNGKNIDADSSVTIRRNFTGLDMVYSSVLGAWSIV